MFLVKEKGRWNKITCLNFFCEPQNILKTEMEQAEKAAAVSYQRGINSQNHCFRIFLKKTLTTAVSLCYSIVAMEEVFFLCLKLILQEKNGGGSCARKDHISMYRMQTA